MGKYDFQEPGVVLLRFYVQLLLFNLVLCLNWVIWPIVKLSILIGLN